MRLFLAKWAEKHYQSGVGANRLANKHSADNDWAKRIAKTECQRWGKGYRVVNKMVVAYC